MPSLNILNELSAINGNPSIHLSIDDFNIIKTALIIGPFFEPTLTTKVTCPKVANFSPLTLVAENCAGSII